jgi:hypothetical protein
VSRLGRHSAGFDSALAQRDSRLPCAELVPHGRCLRIARANAGLLRGASRATRGPRNDKTLCDVLGFRRLKEVHMDFVKTEIEQLEKALNALSLSAASTGYRRSKACSNAPSYRRLISNDCTHCLNCSAPLRRNSAPPGSDERQEVFKISILAGKSCV